jgi:predicted Fe-Mo cluster-binding NifX family protein
MDKERCLIAAASSDGIVVNQHFGRASAFYIYESADGIAEFVEKREVVPVCEGGNHDEIRLLENLKKFSDCKYLLVSKIGDGAAAVAESLGIACYEIPGVIEESIEKMQNYEKIKELLG